MDLPPAEWLAVLEAEYLREFVPRGGAAVKVAVVPGPGAATALRQELSAMASAAGCQVVALDAADVKLHAIDQLFFGIARQVDWDGLAASFVRRLLTANGFALPDGPGPGDYRAIAERNGYDEAELRRDVRRLLTAHVYRDFAMAQEFRIAMTRLCQAQIEDPAELAAEVPAIRDWLRGELRTIAAVKSALIFQRIARHNARDLVLSLAHWLRLVGKQGLVLILDIDRYTLERRPAARGSGFSYSTTAVLDVYEVLRQFIDATDELEGSLIVVLAPPAFLEDEKRGLPRYDPLKLRLWDEVRDQQRANPLAALVRLRGSAGNESPVRI